MSVTEPVAITPEIMALAREALRWKCGAALPLPVLASTLLDVAPHLRMEEAQRLRRRYWHKETKAVTELKRACAFDQAAYDGALALAMIEQQSDESAGGGG